MMASLFSIFDPHSWGLSWALTTSWLALISPSVFVLTSKGDLMCQSAILAIKQHINSMLQATTILQHSLFLAPLFVMILYWNSLGLLPYMFTATSHMSVSFTVALKWYWCVFEFGCLLVVGLSDCLNYYFSEGLLSGGWCSSEVLTFMNCLFWCGM